VHPKVIYLDIKNMFYLKLASKLIISYFVDRKNIFFSFFFFFLKKKKKNIGKHKNGLKRKKKKN